MNLSTKSAFEAKQEVAELCAAGKTGPMHFSQKVVSGSRKRAGGSGLKKVTRYDAIKNNEPSATLRDAGGGNAETGEPGLGWQELKMEPLADEQLAMFKRSALTATILDEDNREQEVRQTNIVVEYTDITVNMRREDFPSISADVPVRFTDEALQAAWGTFLFDVRKALNVEFVDTIVDRRDMAPVNRILELRDKGQYFVRQREESAILEVIQSGKEPEQTSWKVTESINNAKTRLKDSTIAQEKMDVKVDEILQRSTLRDQQRETTYRILEAEEVEEITEAMWDVMNAEDLPPEEFAAAMTIKMQAEAKMKEEEEKRTARLAHLVATGGNAKEILELSQGGNLQAALGGFGEISVKTYDKEVDIVGLHRLAFESIQRLLLKNPEKELDIARASFKFVEETMKIMRHEVDICVLGCKLLSDYSSSLQEYRPEFYDVVMDNIQHYAPANEDYRPPRILRRKLDPQEKSRLAEEWLEQLASDRSGEKVKKDEEKLDMTAFEVDHKADIVFNLEEYLAEQAEIKRLEEEAAAEEASEKERLRLEALAAMEPEEVKATGPFKKVKAPWRGTKGHVGKPKPVEEKHKSMFDGMEDDGKPKKRVLKGFKVIQGSRSLPVVPGIKFRGLVGPYKNDMAMLQCFATLYKFVCASYGNRDKAFLCDMPEEVACIGLVCLGNTRVMEYTMWIIDTIYMDGFMVDAEDEETVGATMVFSVDADADAAQKDKQKMDHGFDEPGPAGSGAKGDAEGKDGNGSIMSSIADDGMNFEAEKSEGKTTIDKKNANSDKTKSNLKSTVNHDDKDNDSKTGDPLVGLDIDCVSTISMPSLDLDGHNARVEENLDPNLGDMKKKDYDDVFTYEPPEDGTVRSENITAGVVLDPEDNERGARYREKAMRANSGLKEEIGEDLYELRYMMRPRDPVVLFCAMVSAHGDLQDREREMAGKWIGIWDDASSRYKRLTVVGKGLSGL